MEISAKIIAHSVSALTGQGIVTWELEYPRFIHSELMTHRLFSRNAASSRAIPVATMIEAVRTNPAKPSHWGRNQAGMQASAQLTGFELESVQMEWQRAAEDAAGWAEVMSYDGAHKQIVNRILEPFQWMKTVMTATELDNWFWLRDHKDAQPEIQVLAHLMWEALQESKPFVLEVGEWHVPYYDRHGQTGVWADYFNDPLEEALAISSSCCAQVSYRKLDDSLEKAKMVYDRLVGSVPVHASPFEHQATPMDATVKHDCSMDGAINLPSHPHTWDKGITHVDREGNFWSGNFKNWIQHRQLIPNNVCWEYPSQYKEQV